MPISFRRLLRKIEDIETVDGVLILRNSSLKLKTVVDNAILRNYAVSSENISNVQELARAIGKDMAYVSRITRLTLLAPEIIHGILTGQLDKIGVEKCKQPFPVLWDEQKKFFGIE